MEALAQPKLSHPINVAEKWNPEKFQTYKRHILRKIAEADVGADPFYHTFIEGVFPDELYAALLEHLLFHKHPDFVQARLQDNPEFRNERFNLVGNQDTVVQYVHKLFSDDDIKFRLVEKFYAEPSFSLSSALRIHEEFEYTYTAGKRFQNIHVDIPPKFISLVFYFPEEPVPQHEQERNATILYDKSLKPHYKARYKENSVAIFIPHFYSYHGFDSTIPRDALVMFYVHPAMMQNWRALRQDQRDSPPFVGLRKFTAQKLRRFPLQEYADKGLSIEKEMRTCLVNAPQGRVIAEKKTQPEQNAAGPQEQVIKSKAGIIKIKKKVR